MHSFMNFRHLFLILFCFAYTIPALADIVQPDARERIIIVGDPYMDTHIPGLDVTLSPKATALLLHFTFKSPAIYNITLDGRDCGGGTVDAPGVRTQRVSFATPRRQESKWELRVAYKLRVVKNTRFGSKLTEKTHDVLQTRLLTVTWQNGKPRLTVTK